MDSYGFLWILWILMDSELKRTGTQRTQHNETNPILGLPASMEALRRGCKRHEWQVDVSG